MAELTSVDLAIVGAGPTGLFAAYAAGFRGLHVALADVYENPGGQVAALYPNKAIYDIPGHPSISGAELVENLVAQASQYSPVMLLGRQVQRLGANTVDRRWRLSLTGDSEVLAQTVLLAGGVGGINVRPLPVGHEWQGRGVSYTVTDPAQYAGLRVVVVGGGDSALDWALELVEHAAHVMVIHRRRAFRAHPGSVAAARSHGVELLTECEVVEALGDTSLTGLVVRDRAGVHHEIDTTAVIGALGLVTDLGPLAEWGLELHEHKVRVDSRMMTNLEGVFAAGDLAWYQGKVALMSTGFGEAATAVNNAAVLIDPEADLAPGHSTDRRGEESAREEGT